MAFSEKSPQISDVRTGSQEIWVSLLAGVDVHRGRHVGLEQAQENCGRIRDLEPMNPIRHPGPCWFTTGQCSPRRFRSTKIYVTEARLILGNKGLELRAVT